ncbi:MAG: hypothetical protein EOO46_19480 [Flavobacterium sp.]|nr:MAG: hypothetical protein EOO46_19480 [Flavobacterium sp.]
MIENCEIKYNQRQAKTGLIVGILFLILAILSRFLGSSPLYFPIGMSALYIAMYFYKKKRSYLEVKDGYIKKDFGPKLLIDDIVDTRRFAGDYIFKTSSEKMVVDKNLIDKNSISDIENLINHIRSKST